MNAPASQSVVPSVEDQVSAAEWATRVDLAACYRLVAHYGWDDLVFTHISARVPGGDHHFLINPYGMLFEEVTASSLVKVDLHGRKVMESPFDVNPAGFVIHSAIHAAREEAACVMHLHTPAGVAVACQKEGLRRSRSSRCSCSRASPITLMRGSRSTRRRSRGSSPTWARAGFSSCRTTAF